MKIAIVIRCCRTHGSSRYVSEIVKEFVKENEVHVFTNNWDPLDPRVHIHKIPTISNNFYLYEASFNFISTIVLKTKKFDIALAQPTRYFSPDVGYMQFVYKEWAEYKKKNNIPLLLGDTLLPMIEKINVKRAKKIITMSENLKEQVIKHYKVPEEKIRVIYSGVNLNEFNPENKKKYNYEIRRKLGIDNNDIVLLFVGNPFKRKGLEYAIEALTKIRKNTKLLVFGKNVGNDIANYQKIAKKLGVRGRFVYGGFTDKISEYFAAGDIFLFPTLYEPFGLVVLEAMASGLPVVVSQEAGAAELVENGKHGLLLNNPKDSDEIAEKVNYLIDNNLIRKFGKNARREAEKHTWERTAKEMLKVFKEVNI